MAGGVEVLYHETQRLGGLADCVPLICILIWGLDGAVPFLQGIDFLLPSSLRELIPFLVEEVKLARLILFLLNDSRRSAYLCSTL